MRFKDALFNEILESFSLAMNRSAPISALFELTLDFKGAWSQHFVHVFDTCTFITRPKLSLVQNCQNFLPIGSRITEYFFENSWNFLGNTLFSRSSHLHHQIQAIWKLTNIQLKDFLISHRQVYFEWQDEVEFEANDLDKQTEEVDLAWSRPWRKYELKNQKLSIQNGLNYRYLIKIRIDSWRIDKNMGWVRRCLLNKKTGRNRWRSFLMITNYRITN